MPRKRGRAKGAMGEAFAWKRQNMGINPGLGKARIVGGHKAGTGKRRKDYGLTKHIPTTRVNPYTGKTETTHKAQSFTGLRRKTPKRKSGILNQLKFW